ncbi:MAG: toll/interleukin-1 receptor domain-containing protein [Bryobacteraceae bacterium]|nr:toll/interleukin-1 receptor domain-containing protein [Bryobacteraceae bacterium]
MSESNVFVSYARSDRRWVDWLRQRLTPHGFRIWTDANSVSIGESWITELNRTTEKADAVVALLSPSYFQSTWCQQETALAVASDVLVIPVLVEPCEVRGVLRYYNLADLTSDPDRGLHSIIEAVERLSAQSAA